MEFVCVGLLLMFVVTQVSCPVSNPFGLFNIKVFLVFPVLQASLRLESCDDSCFYRLDHSRGKSFDEYSCFYMYTIRTSVFAHDKYILLQLIGNL